MYGRVIHNPQPLVWVPAGDGVAAGYLVDGTVTALRAVLVLDPDSEGLRELPLRRLRSGWGEARLANGTAWAVREAPEVRHVSAVPPSLDQLAAMHAALASTSWASEAEAGERATAGQALQVDPELVAGQDVAALWRAVPSAESLQRIEGEAPSDFYARVAAAHAALSCLTSAPTVALANLAGVPRPTAGAWVRRARAAGVYSSNSEEEQQ